jgi:hypothetical protein
MISRADLTGARPVGSIELIRPAAPIGDARQEAFDRFAQQAVGKQFRAEILSRLNDGSFMLKLADIAVRMNLPAGAQVGDTLDLTLIAAQPRPTFLLGAPADPADTADANTTLSNAGRMIDKLLQVAQKEGAPAALVGKTPVVPSPSATTAQVASALKETLTFSGLFYESHVGQWASGDRPLSDLLREPQAKNSSPLLLATALRGNPAADRALPTALPTAAPTAAPPDTPDTLYANDGEAAPIAASARESVNGSQPKTEPTPPTAPAVGKPPPEDAAAAITSKATESHDASTAIGSQAGAAPRAETLNSESVRMISLQLDTLEQQRVVWQGELWPGQPMEWEVTKDAPDSKVPAAERSWQSVVRFELPTLGAVAASIRLTGSRLQVQVRAAKEDTASLLRTHGNELASALDAAGSPLDQLTVKRDDSI